ncbi:MAG: glycosyltransferase family 2 protein [Aliishimia sp.]
MRNLAILTVRNEAAFLLDWLAHHKAVGFTDFLIFSNDCDDGTDDILDRLQELGHVTHLRNDGPYDKGGIQFTALKIAAKHDLVKQADWILPLDIDEFVNIHTGDGTLDALRAALPDATAITLTWRLFGNADQVRFVDAPIPQTFTHCAPTIMHWPWRASMFKTFYANDDTYRKPGVHRPRDSDETRLPNARWFDGEGRELDAKFKTKRLFSPFGRSNYALVQLNHYALGAMESYVLKADRGRAVHSDHLLGLDYWTERNWNTDEDKTIHRYAPQTSEIKTKFLNDSRLHRLHEQAVQWRKDRFDILMEKEPFRALFARLMMASPARPISAKAARFMVSYANKARRNAKQKT